MKDLTTYLLFDGNCREVMTFYKDCLGGDLIAMPFSAAPGGQAPPGAGDRIMHARLANGKAVIMASDGQPGMPFQQGNNFSIAVACESNEETDKLFHALSAGGQVTMPPGETFW